MLKRGLILITIIFLIAILTFLQLEISGQGVRISGPVDEPNIPVVEQKQQTEQDRTDSQVLTVPQPTEINYIYGNGLIASLDDQGNLNYYHKDNLGSVRAITDSLGDVIYTASYQPFGNTVLESGTSEYTYTGKQQDDNGLYYYGARYYDSNLGRFTQVDPIADFSDSPYVYVSNNPLKYIDPEGLSKYNVGNAKPLGPIKNVAPINPIILFTGENAKGMVWFREFSKKVGVDPYAAAAAFASEGFNVQGYKQIEFFASGVWDKTNVNTFAPVGLDSFVDQMANLKAKGLLRADFSMASTDSSTTMNEADERYTQGIFATTRDQAEAFVAMYADFQQQFFADARSLGYDPSTFSQEAIDTWTYRYYIQGRGNTIRFNGEIRKGARSNLRDALQASGPQGLIRDDTKQLSAERKGQKAAATAKQFREEIPN